MSKLTPEGEKIISSLAERYALGADAVRMMLDAVAQGGGTMAQFNLPEFGGSGQWMRGGMTMVGDMFNNSMKATVDSLCNELANLLTTQVSLFAPVPFMQPQTQSQGNSPEVVNSWHASPGAWWPTDLGYPAATGAQNNSRYAYFPNIRRLAVDSGGRPPQRARKTTRATPISPTSAGLRSIAADESRFTIPPATISAVSRSSRAATAH
jgi:hypothetical protein